ncbi:MAG: hypothetical protein H6603_06870 [Flavobacteriales bacterium]|nr:hypothetical protein [Flavobacteriales bacterium]MCB9191893.1 hypothetical protein [Flavobacteriales bacterium]MCB9204686.1 hypothetical protein [Flavobacteriales bacterium]
MKRLLLFSVVIFCVASCKKPETNYIAAFEITLQESGDQSANRLIVVGDRLAVIGTSINGGNSFLNIDFVDFNGVSTLQRSILINTEGISIKCTQDNKLILAGSLTDQNGNKDVLLAKTDSDGNLIWQKTFGGPMTDFATDIIELEDGSLMLIGTTQSFGAGPISMYVIKTDASGNELWSRTFGSDGADGGSELLQVNSNEVMLLGFTNSFGAGDRDNYLQTVSLAGDSLWSTTIGGAAYEESQAIARTSDGGYIMSNHSASEEPNHSLLATKLDMNGATVWEHHFGTIPSHEGGEGVLADSQGNYVFVGRTNSFGNDEQVYFIKTDASGNVLEELNFGADGDQRGNDIIEHNGSYYICGNSTVNGDSDVLLIKRPM